jgi:hypothetical protein
MKAKAHYEFLPIYGRHLFMGNNVVALKNLISQYFKDDEVNLDELDGTSCLGFVCPIHCLKDPERILAFVMYVRPDAGHGTITHETTHLTNQIFSYLGQGLDEDNDEAQAYLAGHLAQVFMEKVRSATKEDPQPLKKRRGRRKK